MKKVLALFILLGAFGTAVNAQESSAKARSIGVSFILNDFSTAQKIRNGSIEQVFREKSWSELRDMDPGLAVTYFQNLHPNVDFAGTLGASYTNAPLRNKTASTRDALLLEADASVNLKMFPDTYWVSPYLGAGLGASKWKDYYGAIVPLGGGLRINVFDEAALFITAQYRVGLTKETTSYHFVYGIGVAGRIGK